MEKEKLDQIKIDLDADTKELVEDESSHKETSKKRAKAQVEPQTISITEGLMVDEDGDTLVPPKKDVFEKMSSCKVTDDSHSGSKNSGNYFSGSGSSGHASASYTKSDSNEFIQSKNNNSFSKKASESSSDVDTGKENIYSDSYEYVNRKQRKNVVFVIVLC